MTLARPLHRHVIAWLTAPLCAPIVAWLLAMFDAFFEKGPVINAETFSGYVGLLRAFVVVGTPIAYGLALVAWLPLMAVFYRRRWEGLRHYQAAGAAMGLVP